MVDLGIQVHPNEPFVSRQRCLPCLERGLGIAVALLVRLWLGCSGCCGGGSRCGGRCRSRCRAAVEAVLATGAVVAAAEAALAFFFDLVVVCDGVVGAVEAGSGREQGSRIARRRGQKGQRLHGGEPFLRVFTSGDQVLDGQIGLRTLR